MLTGPHQTKKTSISPISEDEDLQKIEDSELSEETPSFEDRLRFSGEDFDSDDNVVRLESDPSDSEDAIDDEQSPKHQLSDDTGHYMELAATTPLLSYEDEQRLGRSRDIASRKIYYTILSNDFLADEILKKLEMLLVQNGKGINSLLSLATSDPEGRVRLMAIVNVNCPTARALIQENHRNVKRLFSSETPQQEREQLKITLKRDRLKVAKLLTETEVREGLLLKSMRKLRERAEKIEPIRRLLESPPESIAQRELESMKKLVVAETLRFGETPKVVLQRIAAVEDRFLPEQADFRRQFVEANLRIAIHNAAKFQNRGVDFDDLIQEANTGVMRAAEKFEWERGLRFSTYETNWIKQAVRRAIADQSRTVAIPAHMMSVIGGLRSQSEELTQKLGRKPSDEEQFEASKESGLLTSYQVFSATCALIKNGVSIDNPLSIDSDETYAESLPASQIAPSEEVIDRIERESLHKKLYKALEEIEETNQREATVLRLRHGLGGFKGLDYSSIARVLELTGADSAIEVKEIESCARRKLAAIEVNPKHRELDSLELKVNLLNDQEALVIRLRLGLSGFPPLTLAQTGYAFEVTRERIRQIQKKAEDKLKKLLESMDAD